MKYQMFDLENEDRLSLNLTVVIDKLHRNVEDIVLIQNV